MGFVVRVHKAYPMYDAEYAERVTTGGWLDRISEPVSRSDATACTATTTPTTRC